MDIRTWTELVRLKHSSFHPRSFLWPGKKVLCVPEEENIKYRKLIWKSLKQFLHWMNNWIIELNNVWWIKSNQLNDFTSHIVRAVSRGAGGAWGTMTPPDFARSVNTISTRGDRLCPPNYYWHTQIFRPSDGPEI